MHPARRASVGGWTWAHRFVIVAATRAGAWADGGAGGGSGAREPGGRGPPGRDPDDQDGRAGPRGSVPREAVPGRAVPGTSRAGLRPVRLPVRLGYQRGPDRRPALHRLADRLPGHGDAAGPEHLPGRALGRGNRLDHRRLRPAGRAAGRGQPAARAEAGRRAGPGDGLRAVHRLGARVPHLPRDGPIGPREGLESPRAPLAQHELLRHLAGQRRRVHRRPDLRPCSWRTGAG
jgi:hypothetical protein